MEDVPNLINIFKENWPFIAAFSLVFVGITNWVFKVYQIRKLRLEIHALKEKLQKEKKSTIEIATLEEIERYANHNNDLNKIRKFIVMKADALTEESSLNLSEPESIETTTVALKNIGESNLSIFVRIIPFVLIVWILDTFVTNLIDWVLLSDNALAQTLKSILEISVIIFLVMIAYGLIFEFIEWVYNKFNKN